MANTIKVKRSAVQGAAPTVNQLELGEIAINTYDGKMFIKKNVVGTESVIEVGAGATSYTDEDAQNAVAAAIAAGTHTGITIGYDDPNNSLSFTNTDLGSSAVSTHVGLSDPHTQYQLEANTLSDVAAVTGDIHGVVSRSASTISFNDGTRTFTIAPVSGSWTFYNKGTLYTVSSTLNLTIANTSGARFISINPATLTLVEGGAVPDFVNDVIVAYIYWNATSAKCIILGDERHGSNRDITWHSNQHLNVGTVWRSGGGLGYTLNSQTTVTLDVGTPLAIADEDLLHTITHSATPSADYQQILTTAASLEVLHLSGTSYTSTTASTTPWVSGTNRLRYNQITGGSGSLVEAATNGSYITYWLLATNDTRSPVKLVMGRAEHASLDNAYAEDFTEYGLSFAEQVFMYQIVLQTDAAFTNASNAVIAGVRKIMSKVSSGSSNTVSAADHNSLTNRDGADSHPIGAITNLQTSLDNLVCNLGYTAATRLLTSSTGTDVTLPLFTSTAAGLTPLSGGGTTTYLRADGSWATPNPGGTLTSAQNALAADVQLAVTNTWYTGPTLTLGAGTWLVNVHLTQQRNSNTAETLYARISTGTVHYASTAYYHVAFSGAHSNLKMTAIITLAASTTINAQMATSAGATTSLLKAALATNGVGNNASIMTALKIA